MATERDMQLTLTDIYKMKSIIDVSSTRGTFQGKELSLIGELYNKLEVIVQSVESKDKKEEKEETTTETPVVNETTTTNDECVVNEIREDETTETTTE